MYIPHDGGGLVQMAFAIFGVGLAVQSGLDAGGRAKACDALSRAFEEGLCVTTSSRNEELALCCLVG